MTWVKRPLLVSVHLERVDERQPQEVLVELPGLLGVAAAIRVVMETADDPPDAITRETRCCSVSASAASSGRRARA